MTNEDVVPKVTDAKVRRDLLTAVAFETLLEASEPIRRRNVMRTIREKTALNERELSKSSTGAVRFETFVAFASVMGTRLGWIDKSRNGWELSDKGRQVVQSVPSDDLYRHLSTEYNKLPKGKEIKHRAWLVRDGSPGHETTSEWLSEEYVSLEATHLRKIEPEITRDELRSAILEDYSHLSATANQSKQSEIESFLLKMQPDDLVAVLDDDRVYVGAIAGEWAYQEGPEGTQLTREVEWGDREGSDRAALPSELGARLRSQRNLLDLTQHLSTIELLLEGEETEELPNRGLELPDVSVELARNLHVPKEWLQECIELLNDRPQLVFYGPPGTGKTYIAQALAEHIAGEHVKLVQFHPAYSYEDFFEGFRPTPDGTFKLQPGPLRQLADMALENPGEPYVLIIDEINRGNLARVFGELYFLLEYRDRPVELLYGDEDFFLPKNIFIIGTMNTADRSIALVDSAMRRRFAFVPLLPDVAPIKDVLRTWLARLERPMVVAEMHDELNRRIDDPEFRIGPSYFMREAVFTEGGLERTWRATILPLLEEHHYGEYDAQEVAQLYGYEVIADVVNAEKSANMESSDAAVGTD